MRKRIVIAGCGDTGVLLAIHLGTEFEVVGVSPKPCLVSGQELGQRVTRPEDWKKNYLMAYRRFRRLDGARLVHGVVTSVDTGANTVEVLTADGDKQQESYDALVIAAGVSNGFWRNNRIENLATVNDGIAARARQLRQASSVAIVGGGASGVNLAINLARSARDKPVHLFYSQEQPLPGYHPEVRRKLLAVLSAAGVHLHPVHRAVVPPGFDCDEITTGPVTWSTGQAPFAADATVWTVGRLRPNNEFVPPAMLNDQGFVKVEAQLRVTGYENVFALGDIAATDPQRCSARNGGFRLLANNIRAWAKGDRSGMQAFSAPEYRWGSLYGVQPEGLTAYQPSGGKFRIPRWAMNTLITPLVVHRNIYRGVRQDPDIP